MDLHDVANAINVLGNFCGVRDVPVLDGGHLYARFGIRQADIMVLFGGTVLSGADVFAEAISKQVARKFIIVGGEGHTTPLFREVVRREMLEIMTEKRSEAEILNDYIRCRYGVSADHLECRSTNCGNNITNLLELIGQEGLECSSVILTHDATMQRRIHAGLLKHCGNETLKVIDFAAYRAEVVAEDAGLAFREAIHGMWTVEKYLSLLLGEIARLTDDENGYGPRGKDFIVHTDIPDEVSDVYRFLLCDYSGLVRRADDLMNKSDVRKGNRR